MTKETLRMQMLAGIITESQYKEKLNENKVGNIDLNLVNQLKNNPEIKKLSQKLKADKNLLNKTIKFISDTASVNEINESTENTSQLRIDALKLLGHKMVNKSGVMYLNDKKFDDYSPEELQKLVDAAKQGKEQDKKDLESKTKMSTMDKIKSVLTNAGLGSLFGSIAIPFMSTASAHTDPASLAAGILASALIAVGVGAAATSGYKRKMFTEGDLDVKDQLLNIINLGKQA